MNDNAIRLFVRRELRAVTVGVAVIGFGGGLPAAVAGPVGGTVVSGQGSISSPNAATTLINQQSSRLTLDWSSFNVGGGETVRFVQPSSSAVALNNILSNSPSQIFGRIDANGRVVLVNPNGILFGRTAQLNVGSLIASSLELTGFDPTTGRFSFQSLSGRPGAIDNEGTITAAKGGSVALLGGTVLNNGLIVADYGTVGLGAGKVATLDFYGDGLLRLQVSGTLDANPSGAGAAVQNAGRIQADGGQVLLTASATQDVFASAVNNSGVVRASRIENVGGTIELSGPNGVVENSGTLDASGTGAASTGGTVQVTGYEVGLFGNSAINVSGNAGGGTALIGGDLHGANPGVQDAFRTYVGPGASIDADALTTGNGGKVVVWSDDVTRYFGSLSARGGAVAGNGGFAEVSGEQTLDFHGAANLSAARGAGGTILLDPDAITISANPASGFSAFSSPLWTEPFGSDPGTSNFDVMPTTGSFAGITSGSTVDLQAKNTITLSTAFDLDSATGNPGVSLTLRAGGDVILGSNTITTTGGNISITANDVGGTQTGSGSITGTANLITSGAGASNGAAGSITLAASGTGTISVGNITALGGGGAAAAGGAGGAVSISTADGAIATGAINTSGGSPIS
ncbi:MAG: filamentous hemagglutinin N-terminal domain-containing protein, partial [Steroidobacteraceae bacterium]